MERHFRAFRLVQRTKIGVQIVALATIVTPQMGNFMPLAVTLSAVLVVAGNPFTASASMHRHNYSLKRTAEGRLRYYHTSAAAAA